MKKKHAIVIMLLLAVATLLLNGCSDELNSLSFPKSELKVISFQGFKIPQFPTAHDQLNFAKSGFPDSEEKKAAFEIISYIFPEAEVECGNAALYLAYMNFGYDYRFATKEDYYNAIKAYHDVISNYKGHPQLLVKAYWYLGWIHCDLLQEKEVGIQYFWHIVKTYPDIEIGISSPVPWVSLVYPLTIKGVKPAKDKAKRQWAGIALLEIIRHAHDKTEVDKAFDVLWKEYRKSVSTGLAIKLMLMNEEYAQKALPYVEQYLALDIANLYLAKEIKESAKEY
ncbi:MAG: hypothetical protein KAI40_03035 [Desulfobacterales bacterium]|nr:hypothetical protein [Desulfobacterales bacterium]